MRIIQTASVIFLMGSVSSGALAAPTVAEILATPLVAPASVAEVESRCNAHASAVKAAQASFEAMPLSNDRMKLLRTYDDLYNLAGLLAYAEHYLVQETNPDEAIRKAAEACVVRGAELLTNIGMSRPIFERLNAVNAPGLDPKLRYTVERQLDNYRRSGVDRDEATRTRIAELQNAITATGLEFQKNIRDDIKTLAFKPADLDGLPADYLATRKPGADGLIRIRTVAPDTQPIMQYAKSAATRRTVQIANLSRAAANDPVLKKLFAQRAELARLLGYKNYASFDLANRMVRDPSRAQKFIDEIAAAARPTGQREAAVMLARLRQDDPTVDQLGGWSTGYATRQIKVEQYGVDPEVVRQYFHFDKVQTGIFKLTEDLFGVQIRPLKTKVWSPQVEAFEMVEKGKVVGRFYLDMHPRDGKYTHAAMFPVRIGVKDRIVPEAALLTNFPDGLMEHGQVETYLHEFGHLLHWIFAGQRDLASQNFGEVENDVTEAPSTLLEEWVWDYDTLAKFATNAKGETIPASLVAKMNAGRRFGQAIGTMQQLGLAAASLDYYSNDMTKADLTKAYSDSYGRYALAALPPGAQSQNSFGHLGGYAASYYTYQWSEALAKDLMSRFRAAGLRDTKTAKAYRDLILAPGGSDSMNVLAKSFLGRDWSVESYRRELEGSDVEAVGAAAK